MADLLFVAIVVAFFGIAVLLVRACDAIIGPDPVAPAEPADAPRVIEVEVGAATEAVASR